MILPAVHFCIFQISNQVDFILNHYFGKINYAIKSNSKPYLIMSKIFLMKLLFSFSLIFLASCNSSQNSARHTSDGESSPELTAFINNVLESKDSTFSYLLGKELPSLKGTTITGRSFNSSEFIGRPMVLNFWFIGCPNCYQEIPDINKVYEDSKTEEFEFMSFCTDDISELNNSFELTSDNGYKRKQSQKKEQIMYYDFVTGAKEIAKQLDITAFPVTLTVGKDGKITQVILYTKSFEFPDELITYRLIKAEIARIKNQTF